MICGKNGREKVTVAEVAVGSLNSFFVIYSIYNDAKRLKLEKSGHHFQVSMYSDNPPNFTMDRFSSKNSFHSLFGL